MMPQEITLETKIADLLNNYEGMKEILIGINPKFKKLNNPVLRRTLGKIASVRQAAVVGNMDPKDLVDQLRKAVGQEPICEDCEIKTDECFIPVAEKERPEWANQESQTTLDANALLDADKNPLAEVHNALRTLQPGQMLTLKADFQPEPLIEEFTKQGHATYTYQADTGEYITYIQKKG